MVTADEAPSVIQFQPVPRHGQLAERALKAHSRLDRGYKEMPRRDYPARRGIRATTIPDDDSYRPPRRAKVLRRTTTRVRMRSKTGRELLIEVGTVLAGANG